MHVVCVMLIVDGPAIVFCWLLPDSHNYLGLYNTINTIGGYWTCAVGYISNKRMMQRYIGKKKVRVSVVTFNM